MIIFLSYRPFHQPPSEALRHYETGTQALRSGAYFEASKELEQAIAADGKYALAHSRLAEAYAELDRSDKAKDEVILAHSTSRDQRMEALAELFLQAITSTVVRDFAKATAIYQQIAAQAPAGWLRAAAREGQGRPAAFGLEGGQAQAAVQVTGHAVRDDRASQGAQLPGQRGIVGDPEDAGDAVGGETGRDRVEGEGDGQLAAQVRREADQPGLPHGGRLDRHQHDVVGRR